MLDIVVSAKPIVESSDHVDSKRFSALNKEKLRACLKSAVCRVRTAHQPLIAPEGRKVCRNAETPYT